MRINGPCHGLCSVLDTTAHCSCSVTVSIAYFHKWGGEPSVLFDKKIVVVQKQLVSQGRGREERVVGWGESNQ